MAISLLRSTSLAPDAPVPMSDSYRATPPTRKREFSERYRRLITSATDTTFEYHATCRGHSIVSHINYSHLDRVREFRKTMSPSV